MYEVKKNCLYVRGLLVKWFVWVCYFFRCFTTFVIFHFCKDVRLHAQKFSSNTGNGFDTKYICVSFSAGMLMLTHSNYWQ